VSQLYLMHPLPSNLPAVIKSAAPFVSSYGYFAVAILLILESLGLPLPGETSLIVAGLFAGIGRLNIFLVIVVAIVATTIGANIGFWIGRLGGKKLIIKYGKYVFITKERLTKLEKFFDTRGALVIILSRFVDGLRQLNGIIAGSSGMIWAKYVRYNLIGAIVWVALWTSAGYYGGDHLKTLLRYQVYLAILACIGLVVYILFVVIRSRRGKSHGSKRV
jgi:membrane protein DedA with SNARE-associated domain